MKKWKAYMVDSTRCLLDDLEKDRRIIESLEYFDKSRDLYKREVDFMDQCDTAHLNSSDCPARPSAVYHKDLVTELRKENLILKWVATALGFGAVMVAVFMPKICRATVHVPTPIILRNGVLDEGGWY